MFWQTLGLIAILAAICAAAWFATRLLATRMAPNSAGKHMQVVERLGVAQDKTILLLRVGDKGMLVGVSKQQMHALGEVPLPENIQIQEPTRPIPPLADVFDRFFGKHRKNTAGYAEEVPPEELPEDEREKLEAWTQRRSRERK